MVSNRAGMHDSSWTTDEHELWAAFARSQQRETVRVICMSAVRREPARADDAIAREEGPARVLPFSKRTTFLPQV